MAADLVATFFARYLPPSEETAAGAAIPPSLLPPAVNLSFEQQFYAGAHLSGLQAVPFSDDCAIELSWETAGGSGSVTLGN